MSLYNYITCVTVLAFPWAKWSPPVCTVLRTLSDLGGGVNGHDVNLRDKCGVCDDVTGEKGGWGGVGGGNEYDGTYSVCTDVGGS